MKQIINMDTWKRREYYNFFKDYQETFFGITANVDCTKAYKFTKENNLSFFLYYMYKSMKAVNAIEEFRYRIEESNIVCYDKIHCSTTALNANNMFAFAFFQYTDNFEEFYSQAQQEMKKISTVTDMNMGGDNGRTDVIHYSTIPWISFTCLNQERNFSPSESIPKLTFGKFFKDKESLLLPLSVYVHHGLMDGMHVGQHYEIFQEFMNED